MIQCFRFPGEMSQLDLSGSMWKFPGSPHDSSVWRHSGHMGPPHGHLPAHPPPDSRSRSRDRSRVDLEQRRRAQSKSPARRQASQKYVDSTPDISGLSRMFRDFSGAVRAKMAKKSDTKLSASAMSDLPDPALLKSNLKKQKNIGADVTDNSSNNDKVSNSAADNKKVHFNKFATVQMMG